MSGLLFFVGDLRPLPESGRPTGIYKQPAGGRLRLERDGFVGDHQADRRVHGGPQKAVHCYPASHYRRLAERFPEAAAQLVPGSLGENLSTPDLREETVHVGDRYQLGSARLRLCQPRNPCWKIDERFACDGMAEFIARERLNGWYFSVDHAGEAGPGDQLTLLERQPGAPTLADALRLCQTHRPPLAELDALIATPGIAEQWQAKLMQRAAYLRQAGTDHASPLFHGKPSTP